MRDYLIWAAIMLPILTVAHILLRYILWPNCQ